MALKQRLSYGRRRRKFTGKELDAETGLYYYGARYLDPKTSRWLSGDPAMGEYFPVAPINDDAKKHNGNLPGQGGVFNYVNLHAYHYAGNNPVKLVDPDGEASILTRLINKGSKWYYNFANWAGKKTGWSIFLHSLVDMGDLTSVSQVHQYSGSDSGFTTYDTYSKEHTYTILYSGMDDALTEKAVGNVLKQERFGAGNNEEARKLYKIIINDCNNFKNAVFKEYEKLWKDDFRSKNKNATDPDVNRAWAAHEKEITQNKGKRIEINQ